MLLLSSMETRFKLRISRMFQASLSSCRSRNLSDIIEKSVFVPRIDDQSFRFIDSMAVKLRPFPSICRPDSSETSESIASSRDFLLPRRKVSERSEVEIEPFSGGQICPPVSPLKKSKKKKKKKTRTRMKTKTSFSSMESSNFGGTWWYSSEEEEEEDDEETIFSSKSRSSDSSACHRRRSNRRRRESSEMGLIALKGKVKNSFAVVKKSRDPYNDFRSSMLEMIIEKQIFSGEDLEQLLQCFISLNSHHHHRVILEVFTEIWETLFSDWGS